MPFDGLGKCPFVPSPRIYQRRNLTSRTVTPRQVPLLHPSTPSTPSPRQYKRSPSISAASAGATNRNKRTHGHGREPRGARTVSSSFPRRLGEPSSLAAFPCSPLLPRAPAKRASGGPDEMYLLPATCCRQSLFRVPDTR